MTFEFLCARVVERGAHDPGGDPLSFQFDRYLGVLDDHFFADEQIFRECDLAVETDLEALGCDIVDNRQVGVGRHVDSKKTLTAEDAEDAEEKREEETFYVETVHWLTIHHSKD